MAHFTDCLKRPCQLTFNNARDFDELRSLRNADGSWMRLYCRGTRQEGSFRTTISVIGEAVLETALELGVEGAECWKEIQRGSLNVV